MAKDGLDFSDFDPIVKVTGECWKMPVSLEGKDGFQLKLQRYIIGR